MDNIAISGDTYHNRFAPDRQHNKGSKKFKPLKKKCAICGTTSGQLDIDHKDGNRDNNNRSNLRYLCRSCHRKMHAERNGGKGSVNIYSTAARIIESIGNQEKAIANKHQNSDLMYIEFILCHEGVNKNKDEFTSEDLANAALTAINKPINWEHRNINIGVIYESKFVSVKELEGEAKAYYEDFDPLEKDFIVCKACIWEYKHPREANIMRQKHASGNLYFSMEDLFEKAKCSECNEVFDNPYDYCDHLLMRKNNGKASRIFINSNFVGAAYTSIPADEGAINLALASIIEEISFDKIAKSKFISQIDIKDTIIPYIVNTERFDMKIEKKENIPDIYQNKLDNLNDELFADNINRLFPIDSEANVEDSASTILNNELEFYSSSEKIVVAERLAKALKENNLVIESYIEEDKGGSTEMTIDKNSPEFKEAVNQAVASKLKEIESGVALEETKEQLAVANKAKEEAEKVLEEAKEATAKVQKEFDDFKAKTEKEKKATARIADLKNKGIEFEDNSFMTKMASTASDEDFDEFVNTLIKTNEKAEAKFKKEETPMTDEEKKKLEEKKKKEAKANTNNDPVTESQEVAVASKVDDVATASEENVVDECLKDLLGI